MHYTTYLAAITAALPLTNAVGTATVRNYCPKPVCVYQGSDTYTLAANGTGAYEHTFAYPANGMTGAQIRVSPTCDPNNIVYWEFAQGNNIIYYDVNTNSAQDPFTVRGLGVIGSSPNCPSISCAPGGSLACFNNPNGHNQNQVKACQSTNSIYFNACKP